MPPARPGALLCAGVLQRLAEAAKLPIIAPSTLLPGIACRIAAALLQYADSHGCKRQQPTLAGTVQRAHRIAKHADAVLKLLDADYRGPDGSLPPYVPLPGWLIADPARSVPGIGTAIADAARAAMLAEAEMHLDAPSAFGAHDVARVAVAALRQLAALADTAAKHVAMVRPTRYDPAVRELFAELADAFEELHGRPFAVSNQKRPVYGTSPQRESLPGGAAMRWTRTLFEHAADAAAGMPSEQALRQLAKDGADRQDGLAKRIREARHPPGRRRHFYRAAISQVKRHTKRSGL
jgi:hypothetical protein